MRRVVSSVVCVAMLTMLLMALSGCDKPTYTGGNGPAPASNGAGGNGPGGGAGGNGPGGNGPSGNGPGH